MKFAVQLYNFRKELAEDFVGTLRRIAALGYDGVEIAGDRGPLPPYGLAVLLRETGLECAGFMFDSEELLDSGNIAYEYAEAVHTPAVTINALVDFSREWRNIAAACDRIGAAAAEHGIVMSYHTHWAECEPVDGVPALFRILDATDPAQVFLEPDVCWLTRGKLDPAAVIRKYDSRITQVHLKDILVPDEVETTTELGKGVIDLRGSLAAASEIGAKWLIYEQDCCDDPFRSAAESLEYLKRQVL